MGLKTPSARWRRAIMTKILQPLADFKPDLVLISAGFDAHAHDPLGAGALHEVEFEWMTAELVAIAETHCDGAPLPPLIRMTNDRDERATARRTRMSHAAGRLVSVLEGGYQITGGGVSSLAAGVASHVGTLMSPSLVGATWNSQAALDRFEKVIES